MLPWPLRRILRGVRRDDLASHLLRALDDRVLTVARERGLVRVEHRSGDPDRTFVRRCDEHAILNELAARPDIVGWLRREARRILRSEHLVRLAPSLASGVAESRDRSWELEGGLLKVESDVGLGSSRYLEGEPDGWALWAADHILASEHARRGQRTRAAVIGAGVGGIARALATRGSTLVDLDEGDWIHDEFSVSCTPNFRDDGRRPRGEAALQGGHHAVVVVFPSPATPAASQHRRIYSADSDAGVVDDPSRLGPQRWLRSLSGHLELALRALRSGRLGYLLLPTSVRDARGYLFDEQLTRRVHETVAGSGMQVVASNAVEDVAPVAWPFVGTSRPNRLSLIVQREAI